MSTTARHQLLADTSDQRLIDRMRSARGNATRYGGFTPWVEPPPEFRGSSNQVAGMWPFVVGSAAPAIGVPLGPHLLNGSTVCMDPISWFEQAIILNPSQIIVANTSTGKSTLIRRQCIGLAGAGIMPIIAGDLKGEHVSTVKALRGQVPKLGRGLDTINPLGLGTLDEAAHRLERLAPAEAAVLREEAHGRRLNILKALIAIRRQAPVTETESTVMSRSLHILAADPKHAHTPPVLADLVQLLRDPTRELREATLDRGDLTRYQDATDGLMQSLMGLMDGEFGSIFSGQTTTPLDLDAPAICVDISALDASDFTLKAALLVATWNEVFATIEANNALADNGLAPQRHVYIVLDELWQVLLAAPELVMYINFLTRLNRHYGVGQTMATHSLADQEAFDTERERKQARGFAERSGAVILGALPEAELEAMAKVVKLSDAEADQITRWSTPRKISKESTEAGRRRARPGAGKFLIKVGHRAGIPVQVKLTAAELGAQLHNTDNRWTNEEKQEPAYS